MLIGVGTGVGDIVAIGVCVTVTTGCVTTRVSAKCGIGSSKVPPATINSCTVTWEPLIVRSVIVPFSWTMLKTGAAEAVVTRRSVRRIIHFIQISQLVRLSKFLKKRVSVFC